MAKKSSSDPALAAAVEATIVALAALPAKAVLAAAKASPMLFFGPETHTDPNDRRPLAKAFASTSDLTKAIDQRTPEIKAMALTLLVNADEEAGAPFLLPIMRRDLTDYPFGTWEMDLFYTVGAALQQLSKRLSPAVFVELLALGRISEQYLPKGTFAKVSPDDLARIAKEQPSARLPGYLLLRENVALRDPAKLLKLAEQLPPSQDDLLEEAFSALAEANHVAALPFLLRFSESDAPAQVRGRASDAIGAMDCPEAWKLFAPKLKSSLEDPWSPGGTGFFSRALNATLGLHPETSTEVLSGYFTPAALGTKKGLSRAEAILFARSGGPDEVASKFDGDPRWLDVAAGLLGGPVRETARAFLASYDAKTVAAALKRAGHVAPGKTKPRLHPLPKAPRWLKRYEAGEHEAVWAEIVALEDSAQDAAVVEEASAVARAMMRRVKANLEGILAVLAKRKYKLAAKTAKKALAPPDAKLAQQTKALEAIVGAPLPLSLRAFWEIVGSVDLTEHEAASSSEGLGAHDPLLVAAPKLVLSLVKDRADHEKRLPAALREPIRDLVVGLDPQTKADEDAPNDAPYTLTIVGSRADAVLRQGDRETTFVAYLREAIAAGGFPGPAVLTPEDEPRDASALLAAVRKGRTPF